MENLVALAILLAFCFAIYALLGSVIGKLTNRPFLIQSAQRAVYTVWLLVTVGAGVLEASVIHTPGHTEGSICLYFPAEGKLIAGDTLFAGSIGRTDLPGGSMQKIINSLHEKVLALPDETLVIPGHGPLTTIGEERESNPFLVKK